MIFVKICIINLAENQFLDLKPPCDQDRANKKKFSQIGTAVPEEIGNIQASKQTSCCFSIKN